MASLDFCYPDGGDCQYLSVPVLISNTPLCISSWDSYVVYLPKALSKARTKLYRRIKWYLSVDTEQILQLLQAYWYGNC